jgi:hypothetical protein
MGCKVQRPIRSDYFTDIPTTREMMKTLPEEARICAECGEEVTIVGSDFIPNPGDGAPIGKAAFVGCDASIDKVVALSPHVQQMIGNG